MELSDDDRKFIGFNLACRLEDYEKDLKKQVGKDLTHPAWEQFFKLEKLVYTKIIPESWSGAPSKNWK